MFAHKPTIVIHTKQLTLEAHPNWNAEIDFNRTRGSYRPPSSPPPTILGSLHFFAHFLLPAHKHTHTHTCAQITFHTWWLLGGDGAGRVQQQQLQPVAALAGGAFLVFRRHFTAQLGGVPVLRSRSSCGPRYVGGATGCFSESFAYQGVYCPSELSLFSRPPSWQLVRTPKVIRLHNTHTVPLRNLLQNTSARRSPLSLSLALCSGESFAFFVRSAFFVALRHQSGQLRNFRPAGFRSDGSGVHAHTLKLTEIADSTQFFPFLCLFFVAFKREPLFSSSSADNFLSLSRVTTATFFTDSSTGTTFPPHNPEHSPFEGTSKLLLLLFFFSLVWPGAFSLFLLLLAFLRAHTHTHKHAPTQRARDGQLWLENAPFLANTSQNGHSPTTLRRVSTGGKSGFSHDTPLVPSSVVCGKTELFFPPRGE